MTLIDGAGVMDVRRRNRIIVAAYMAVAVAGLATILAILWQADLAPAIVVLPLAIGFFIWLAWDTARRHRDVREVEETLRRSGMDPDAIPETPIPVLPPLARDRNELVAGILFLLLLVVTFVAHWAGWGDRWLGP